MNEKYVITAIHKDDAFYGDRKEIVGHWVYIDPEKTEKTADHPGWSYVENDSSTSLLQDIDVTFFAVKLMPLSEYKRRHPDSIVRKVSKRILES